MNYKHIHFTGIKGVGMASLALAVKEAGLFVTGSDTAEIFITDEVLTKAGIKVYNGFNSENIKPADLVIYTGAHGGLDNPEVNSARDQGIAVVSLAQGIGMLIEGSLINRKFVCIAVAGTHGKTTTSSMLATILKENGMDPSYLIGTSSIPSLGAAGHIGNGDYLIIEADEYATDPKYDLKPKFSWYKPSILVITNIEHDHPDIYHDLDSVRLAFTNYIAKLDKDSILIINGDDILQSKITKDFKGKCITFGKSAGNDYCLKDITHDESGSDFTLEIKSFKSPRFKLNVYGEHNCLNAAAAIIGAKQTGLGYEKIRQGILRFSGSKRRLEYLGISKNGAKIYDDYGHHPTEITATLKALRNLYPDKKIICLFQPHTFSRTKAFFDGFVSSFTNADEIILLDIFTSAREIADLSITSADLVEAMVKNNLKAGLFNTNEDMLKYLNVNLNKDTVLLTIGAGDVYKIAEKLITAG